MKITIEFDDKIDALMALNAWQFSSCLDDVDNYLRNTLKHGDLTDEVHDALQKVRDMLNENKPRIEE